MSAPPIQFLIHLGSFTALAGAMFYPCQLVSDLVNVSSGTGVGSIEGYHGAGDSILISSSRQSAGAIQAGTGLAHYEVENYIETSARVIQKLVFYNNSYHDSFDPGANSLDDAAVARDKVIFLSGISPDFSSYTSYSNGINGVMLDVVNLKSIPDSADFSFKNGNNDSPSSWLDAPNPVSISVRSAAGLDGSDRVTLIWADSAVVSTWLQIQLLEGAEAGFLLDEWYYIGNAPGETGDDSLAHVNASDLLRIRSNLVSIFDPAATTENLFDINRDGFVNAQDFLITRSNPTSLIDGSALNLNPMQHPEEE